jgi:hypothetical protein
MTIILTAKRLLKRDPFPEIFTFHTSINAKLKKYLEFRGFDFAKPILKHRDVKENSIIFEQADSDLKFKETP